MALADRHVTQKNFRKEMKKVHATLKDHDNEFKGIHRVLDSMDRRITQLGIDMHQGFSRLSEQISSLVSEIRQDRLETHQLRTRVTQIEERIDG